MARFNVETVSAIVSAMVSEFGGREVPNAVLKAWLCATFPTHFPSGRADGFVEYIAAVDFASTINKAGVSGYAILRGIKRDRARLWLVPSEVPAALSTKGEAFGAMGAAVPAPLPTKKRTTIRFGEYVAAAKAKGEGE